MQLGEKQRGMILNRLRRRMQILGLKTEDEYVEYYVENHEDEFKQLLSLLTTHHTFFFREFKQFEHLRDVVLPKLIPKVRARADRTLRVWSAACSRGHETYSLAIFLDLILREQAPDIKLRINGSDVDGISVDFAANGVFLKREIDSVPVIFQSGNFVRGSSGLEDYVKVHSRIRSMCDYSVGNLGDIKTWPVGMFDVIFCRNVFIYFSIADIARVMSNMKSRLHERGAIYLGLTESINGVTTVVSPIGPSVYGREEEWTNKLGVTRSSGSRALDAGSESVKAMPARKRRVLCVDDSPVVLKLLGEIFSPQSNFVVEHTATNGKEAARLVEKNTYDLITLDIHMPEMTGLEFMQNVYRKTFPPVIVVSSVDRTDDKLALEMMRLGAKDYVQKPSLKDFTRYKEEFLLKANAVCGHSMATALGGVDQLFAKKNQEIASGVVAVFFRESDWKRALDFVRMNRSARITFELIYIEDAKTEKNWSDHFSSSMDSITRIYKQKGAEGCFHLPKMNVAVVLSRFERNQLSAFKFMKNATYLAEEAYAVSDRKIVEDFDLFPQASLSYMVKKSLLESLKKGA